MAKAKFDWPSNEAQREENLQATDPREIEASLLRVLGPQISRMVGEAFEQNLQQLQLDRVDRRYLRFPEADERALPLMPRDLTDLTRWSETPDNVRTRKKVMMRAFFRHVLCRTPVQRSLEDHGQVDDVIVRTLSSTDGEGGYLIPPGFIPYLVRDIPRMSVLFPLVTVWPVVGDSGIMPTVATNAASSWGSESTAISSTDPSFGDASYTIRRHNALATLPRELVVDTNPSIVDVVVSLIQQAMAEERDRVIAYGSGTGKPQGIYQATGIADVSGITAITFPNLNKLLYSVDMRYHDDPTFRWGFNQNVLNACVGLVDDEGRPLLQSALANGTGPTLLGKPFIVSNSWPNTFIGVGAFRYYFWFDRQDMGMETSTEAGDAFDKHQMKVKVWERADGKFVSPPTKPFARSKILAGITNLVTPS